jgi:hypothetical protein
MIIPPHEAVAMLSLALAESKRARPAPTFPLDF